MGIAHWYHTRSAPGVNVTARPEMSGGGKFPRLKPIAIGQGLSIRIVDAESAGNCNDGPGRRHFSWLGHVLEREPTKVSRQLAGAN